MLPKYTGVPTMMPPTAGSDSFGTSLAKSLFPPAAAGSNTGMSMIASSINSVRMRGLTFPAASRQTSSPAAVVLPGRGLQETPTILTALPAAAPAGWAAACPARPATATAPAAPRRLLLFTSRFIALLLKRSALCEAPETRTASAALDPQRQSAIGNRQPVRRSLGEAGSAMGLSPSCLHSPLRDAPRQGEAVGSPSASKRVARPTCCQPPTTGDWAPDRMPLAWRAGNRITSCFPGCRCCRMRISTTMHGATHG